MFQSIPLYEKISKCLKAKRTIERNLYKKSTSVRYSCENKTVEVSKTQMVQITL